MEYQGQQNDEEKGMDAIGASASKDGNQPQLPEQEEKIGLGDVPIPMASEGTEGDTMDKTLHGNMDPYALTERVDLVVLFVASVIELAQASKDCSNLGYCRKQMGFAVSVGTISLAAVLTYVAIIRTKSFTDKIGLVMKVTAYGLAALWTAGTIILTFDLPFADTGNGYFSTWIAYIASLHFMSVCVPETRKHFESVRSFLVPNNSGVQKAILAIFVGSAFELIAAIVVCSEDKNCTGNNGWAIACGLVSVILALVHLVKPAMMSPHAKFMAPFFVLWWTAGTGWLTFGGPFIHTGNGYFATWCCMFASAYFLFVAYVTSHGTNPGQHLTYNEIEE